MSSPTAAGALFGVSTVAAAGYAAMSKAVFRGKTSDADASVRNAIVERPRRTAKKLSKTTGHIGKWYVLVPVALLGGALLAKRRRWVGAATVVGSSVLASVTSPILDRAMKFRVPPPGKGEISQSYPSGHALETTAVSIAGAWVLAREGFVSPWVATPIAVFASLLSGVGRLVLDRHWVTDGAAGYCAGIALGCASAGAYETVSRRL